MKRLMTPLLLLLLSAFSVAQNVGIGTVTPLEKLDIIGNLRLSGTIVQDTMTKATFAPHWKHYGAEYEEVTFWKDKQGMVHIQGLAISETGAGTTVFTLPVGCRPKGRIIFPGTSNTSYYNNLAQRIDIDAAGNVISLSATVPLYISFNLNFRPSN